MNLKMTEVLWSEGYCYFLDFLYIAYYPIKNCVTGRVNGPRFPKVSRQLLSSLGNNEARKMTGIFVNQLQRLYGHTRIPDYITYQNRYHFLEKRHFFIILFSTVLVVLNLN